MHSLPKHRRILGDTIRKYRKKLRFSQERLAEKADLSPVYVSRVECGKENISIDALARVAKALAVRVRDLTRGM